MNSATTDPITREAVKQFLGQLSDEQKRYAFLLLSGSVLGPVKERRAVYDENGTLLGDYLPIPKVQPGQKVTMSDEARDALSNTERMTREQWKTGGAKPAEPTA